MKAFLIVSLFAIASLEAGEKAPKPESPPRVTVGGQVRAPGPITHTKNLTLYAAIQAARGATEFGSMKRVKIIRDGKPMIYDLTDDKQKVVKLQPDDLVEVPQKSIFGR